MKLMSRLTNLIFAYFQNKIKRTYCKWALSKKRRRLDSLTSFEKKFLMVLRRVCLLPDSEFDYGYRTDIGRIVSNTRVGVTIQVRGNEVKFFDSEMITVFFTTAETAEYIVSIFDRATDRRANRKAAVVSEMQFEHLRKIEGSLITKVRYGPDDIKYRPKIIGKTLEIIIGD
jgi:hypothetical protein